MQDRPAADAPRFERRQLLLTALAGAASGLPAFAGAQPAPKRGGVLKLAAPANPSSLDPATGGSGLDQTFLWTMFDTLIDFDYPTLRPVPGMASWDTPTPTTFVLTIRPGIVFHDGTPMDAAAVKANLDRYRADVRSNLKGELSNVTGVEVTGPLQVRLTLAQPDAAMAALLTDRSGMMCSPRAVKELGNAHDRQPVGTGPWKFVSWADNQKLVVTRHERYWKPNQPSLDGIEFAIITELATNLRSAIAGQNQMTYNVSPRSRPIADKSRLVIVTGPTVYCYKLYYNFARGPLKNVKVRQAINYALDRESFIKATMGGIGEPARMLLPSQHWAFDKATAEMYPHDPAKARALLKESGMENVEITFAGYNNQEALQRSEVLIEQMGRSGIKAKFTNGTVGELSAQYFGTEKKFDVLVAATTGRADPSLSYAAMNDKESYYNAGRVELSPELTALIVESRSREDLEFRRKVLAKVQRLYMELALDAPLTFMTEIDAMAANVKGYRPNLLGKPRFNDVWLDG